MKELVYVANAHTEHVRRWTKHFVDKGYFINVVSHDGVYTPETGWTYPKNPFVFYNNLDNVKVHTVSRGWKRLYETRKIVKKCKPDILHAHSVFGQGFFASFSGFKPFVVSAWGWDIRVTPNESYLKKQAVKQALRKATVIHTQCKLSKDIIEKLCSNPDKIFVQSWGVNVDEFHPSNYDKSLKEQHQIDNGPVAIVVREMNKKYSITELFRSLPLVIEKIPNFKLLVLNEGHLQPNFESYLELKGIRKNVEFLGFVGLEKYKKYLASVDLFIDTFYPLDGRGGQMFGQGLLEAISSGTYPIVAMRPTISTYTSDDCWYFGDTYTHNDAKELARKIIHYSEYPELKKTGIEKGLQKIRKDFNWNINIEKIERDIYGL